jgi:hypothetical protein
VRRARAWFQRLLATLGREPPNADQELERELESHLQLHVDDLVRGGMTPEAARRQAELDLGGVAATKEAVRDRRRLPALETVWQDVRHGARMLRKNRGFTAVVVATFALTIGANTAIFGAVNAVLLQTLPYPDGDRLVVLRSTDLRIPGSRMPVAPGDFADWQAQARSYSGLASSSDVVYTLTGDGEPENVIGYRFDPEVVGRTIQLDAHPDRRRRAVAAAGLGVRVDQPVAYVMTRNALVADALAVPRTTTWLVSFFAALAIALAAMGVYGLLAEIVLERRHEIGIRWRWARSPARCCVRCCGGLPR